MKALSRWLAQAIILCGTMFIVQAAIDVPLVGAEDISNIDRGVILDRIRSHLWFRQANPRGYTSGLDDLSTLYGMDILNDLKGDGLRQTLEAEEWFRRSENKGPQDIKTLFQQTR